MCVFFLSFSVMWYIIAIDYICRNNIASSFKSHLAIVYNLFDVLLNLFGCYFIENFCIYVLQRFGPLVFLWFLFFKTFSSLFMNRNFNITYLIFPYPQQFIILNISCREPRNIVKLLFISLM